MYNKTEEGDDLSELIIIYLEKPTLTHFIKYLQHLVVVMKFILNLLSWLMVGYSIIDTMQLLNH